MSHVSCLVQAGSQAHEHASELERRLRDHHAEHAPAEQLGVSWNSAAPGFMFTEGRQSTSSIIACILDRETTLDFREQYMRGICDLWIDVTGCTEHEIVVSITEAPGSED